MIIGYQGDVGSNSEKATKVFVKKIDLKDVELVPLISSLNVISSLKKGKIDFGVVAVKNSIGGEVEETKKALEKLNYEIVDELDLNIHHSLFKKNKYIKDSELKYIASHEQALKQTKNFIKNNYNNLILKEIEDTAIGAKWLENGKLDSNVAIICNKEIGGKYNLFLIKENIEDSSSNRTTFILIKKILY